MTFAAPASPWLPSGAARLVPRSGTGPWPAPRWVTAYATAVLVLSTGAPFAVLASDDSHPLVQPLWLCAYAVAGVALADGLVRTRRRMAAPPFVLGFCALAAASVLWSVAPEVSLRRVFALCGTVLVALLIAQRLTAVEVLECARRAVLLVAVVSLLLYLVGDPRAFDVVHGTLRGVLATKNTLGRILGLGLLASVCVALVLPERRRRCALGAAPMVVALLLSRSAAGLLTGLIVLTGYVVVRLALSRRGRPALAGGLLVVLGVLTVASPVLSVEAVASALGRDTTLTGRTDIWRLSADAVERRPVSGYGYGAFWHPDGADEARQIQAQMQYTVPHAHNGLLDVALELGLIGPLVALAVVGTVFVHAAADAAAGRWQGATAKTAIGSLLVLSNLVESSFLDENSMLTLVLVAVLAASPGPGHDDAADEAVA